MRNKRFSKAKSTSMSKNALVESIMAKVTPIIKEALAEELPSKNSDIIVSKDDWSYSYTLNAYGKSGRQEAVAIFDFTLLYDIKAGDTIWYFRAECVESDWRRFHVGDEFEFEVDSDGVKFDSFYAEMLIEDTFSEKIMEEW